MTAVPSAEEQVRFLLNLQRLLAEGDFVATYKHALLLSIADACVERGDDTGVRLSITAGELAERFIAYYWRQALPYQPLGRDSRGAILKQNTGAQAAIVTAVARAREEYGGSLLQLKGRGRAWAKLRSEVAKTIRKQPLWRLQNVGRGRLEFLYDHDPRQGAEIEIKEGVCFCFRTFHGLVHELVRGAWVRFVRNIGENAPLLGEAAELSAFMFGAGRAPLDAYRPVLAEYQRGSCFYCARPLGKDAEVDHFIPWSRYPVDFGHNFVLAHGSCNQRKADRLAALEHLGRWCERNAEHGDALAAAFRERNVIHDLRASWRVPSWAYEQAQRAGSLVWVRGAELVALTPCWRELMPRLQEPAGS
jgi:hypothetical protein